ncbi:MAG: TonB-dependent receptor [Pseudomonadota bacterium]
MRSFPRHPLTVAHAFALGTLWNPLPALSQELVLEEVVVTARRRVESLQETPVAVTALDSDALREAGVRNLSDLNQVAPNIDVAAANGTAPLANIYIRGVGQRNTGANIDSGVGIYIDDVYIGRPDGALLDLNDIQSVQVLRGPQGTLFGKNTTGGAMVFTTNKPIEEFEGKVGVRAGNYDRLDGDFMLNVPLTDSLWMRFSGVARSRDGYLDNLFDGEDYMDEDRYSLNWQTRWLPTDSMTVDLKLDYAKTEQTMRPNKCVVVDGYVGWQSTLFDQVGILPATGQSYTDFCQEAEEAGGGDLTKVVTDLGGDYEAENYGASAVVEWDISDNLTMKSITAYRYTDALQNDDLDHSETPFLHRTNSEHPFSVPAETDQYSQELQLIGSAFEDRLQYVAGLFWFREETDDRITVNVLGPYAPSIAGPTSFFYSTSATQLFADNKATAAFVQAEWSFNDNWRLTAGLRYTDETRSLSRDRFVPVAESFDSNGGPVFEVAPNSGIYVTSPDFNFNPAYEFEQLDFTRDKTSDDDISPMISLQYILDGGGIFDSGSLYATYSEAFLSGGLSEAPSGELEEFLPEEVENYEIGFKLDTLGRRLRFNGALFYTDYTNRQLTTIAINPVLNSIAGATINAKESNITGFELETTWLATDNLVINFNATWSDGEIEEFEDVQITVLEGGQDPDPGCLPSDLSLITVQQCRIDRSAENLPRLAEETYLLAAQYNLETRAGLFLPRIQASWKMDMDFCFDAASCETGLWLEDEQFELSARLTWISRDERWMGALYGTNLTDEDYLVGGIALVESSGAGGYAVAPPRMYGAELEYRF